MREWDNEFEQSLNTRRLPMRHLAVGRPTVISIEYVALDHLVIRFEARIDKTTNALVL